jgi:hypothetical protein
LPGKLSDQDEWNVTRLNQALLLAKQPTVSRDFYSMFFRRTGRGQVLKGGVVRFRGMAMLRFGNFRFAYKRLAQKHEADLKRELGVYVISREERQEFFRQRSSAQVLLDEIDESKRWYLGYLSGGLAKQDAITVSAVLCRLGRQRQKEVERALARADLIQQFQRRLAEVRTSDARRFEKNIEQLDEQMNRIEADIEEAQDRGIRNTSAYLSSDRLDIYLATSMREGWEYESAAKLARAVFSRRILRDLRLVYFDPTLCYSRDRLDKGLIEGLMLKRARCTLYMVQETDTLGKDSELASTLAQGKPVIAYVPREGLKKIRARLRSAQLKFVTKRLMLLMAEDRLDRRELKEAADFISVAAAFAPIFKLVGSEESDFLGSHRLLWARVKDILARAEAAYFEKRAKTLTGDHPLAMQVHLESGVANGVLVARSPEECAELILALLTNDCKFTIERGAGAYILREKVSQCPFRVVTDDPMLTNSFWDLYGRTQEL